MLAMASAAAATMATIQQSDRQRKMAEESHENAEEGHEPDVHRPPPAVSGDVGALRQNLSMAHLFPSHKSKEGPKRKKEKCISCNQGTTDVPLDELAMSKYGVPFHKLDKLQGTTIIREDTRRCRCLLNPGSPSMQRWGIVVLLALVFTSVMTPFEVAFIEPSINALFFLNRMIDMVFIIDMIFNFLLMYNVSTAAGTIWVKSHWLIAKRYFKSWFIIDVISIIPFDIASLLNSDDPILSKLKGLRVIRAFRMLKLVRMMKAAKFLEQLQNNVAISFAKISLVKVSVGLFLISHWMACFWGLMGKLVGTSLECKTDTYEPEWHPKSDNSGVSWIYAHYYEDEHRDSPCNPWHLYASSLHYSIMTISSIGHGDINPRRVEEYYLCCICMLIGAITWAYTIGTMSGALASLDPLADYFQGVMDNLNYMTRDEEMPEYLRIRLREHFNDSLNQMKRESYIELKDQMSPTLLGDAILQENYMLLQKVWYFKHCHRDFMVEVASRLHDWTYAARERIQSRETLFMLRRGVVAYPGQIMTAGGYWGSDIILEAESLRTKCDTMAVTFCELSCLKRSDLMAAVREHPKEWKILNKARMRLAVVRGVIAQAREARQQMYEAGIIKPGADRKQFLSNFLIQASMTVLIDEKADDSTKAHPGSNDGWPSDSDLQDESEFSVTGSPQHSPFRKASSKTSLGGSMRAAADASTKVSDPPPSAPDTEFPKKRMMEAIKCAEGSIPEEAAQALRGPELPGMPDDQDNDLQAAISTLNSGHMEESSNAVQMSTSMMPPIKFPELPEAFDGSAQKHSKGPIAQVSAKGIKRIAEAIASKVEKQPSFLRSTTFTTGCTQEEKRKVPWRLRGGVKRRGTH